MLGARGWTSAAVLCALAVAAGAQVTTAERIETLKKRVETAEERAEEARARRQRLAAGEQPEAEGCEWDGMQLIGKCVAAGKRSPDVMSAAQCKRRCCGAGLSCVSWQWRPDAGCQLMEDVRVGPKEHGSRNTGGYCEETAPAAWRGKELRTRRTAYDCEWEDEVLEGQCWGLGPARPAGEKSEAACASACCADPECGVWQWRADKGCFYTNKRGQCDQPSLIPYEGGRRVIPKGCHVNDGKIVC
eukprot:TRINITY_DN60331_c0_g1_i1.p2 TRINITY_DN60331_c0_g1~~TRINITY_DN60331_c0_g1_i1.p2  ORF type:complete len:271 (+),score=77.35 TRINITY_DN60331_c0_g1_i1:81-815(+)